LFVSFAGLGMIVFSFVYGIYLSSRGHKWRASNMMLWRCGSQAFTVLAFIGGVSLGVHNRNTDLPENDS
jgi:hypothetical protein